MLPIGGFQEKVSFKSDKNCLPNPRTIAGTITFVGNIGTATFTTPNIDFYSEGDAYNAYFYNGNGSANEVIKIKSVLDYNKILLESTPTGTLTAVPIRLVRGDIKSLYIANIGASSGTVNGVTVAAGDAYPSIGANDYLQPIVYNATGTTFEIHAMI